MNANNIIHRRFVFSHFDVTNPIFASKNITIGSSNIVPNQKTIPTVIDTTDAEVICGVAKLL